MNTIQKQIDEMKTQGFKFGFANNGVVGGTECDHCGRQNITLILVYATQDNLEDADPVADCVFTLGTTCIKKFQF